MAHIRNLTPLQFPVLTLSPDARGSFCFEKPQQLCLVHPKKKVAKRLDRFAQFARVIGLDHPDGINGATSVSW